MFSRLTTQTARPAQRTLSTLLALRPQPRTYTTHPASAPLADREHALESHWINQHEQSQLKQFKESYLRSRASAATIDAKDGTPTQSEDAIMRAYMAERVQKGAPKLRVQAGVRPGEEDRIVVTGGGSGSGGDVFLKRGRAQEEMWIKQHEKK